MITPFHTGIVTQDVEATKRTMTDALGVTWSPPLVEHVTIWTPDGMLEADFEGAFSVSDRGRFELIKAIPNTLWEPRSGAYYHHVSYWTDDLVADARGLREKGFVVHAAGDDGDQPRHFAYLWHDAVGYVELLDEVDRDMYERLWAEDADFGDEAVVMEAAR